MLTRISRLARARRRLSAAGALANDVTIGERRFAVGDDVLATRNDYRILVFNGTRATSPASTATAGVSTPSTRPATR